MLCCTENDPQRLASQKWQAHEYTHDSTALSSDSSPIGQPSSLFACTLTVLLMCNHQQHSNMLLILHLCRHGVWHCQGLSQPTSAVAFFAEPDGDVGTSPDAQIGMGDSTLKGDVWDVLWLCIGSLMRFVCAADGTLSMWGNNVYGQLGDGTTVNQNSPVQVTIARCSTISATALGGYHSAALCAGMCVPGFHTTSVYIGDAMFGP